MSRLMSCSGLVLPIPEQHGSTAASMASVWQHELNAVKQQQGHQAGPDLQVSTYAAPPPGVALQHATSTDAAVSSSRAAASDSRSDNESLHAHAGLPGLQLPQQAAGLDPQLSGATDSAG